MEAKEDSHSPAFSETTAGGFVEDYSTAEIIPLTEVTEKDLARIKEAQKRADRIGKFGCRFIGPVYPGYLDAYMTIRPLLVRLTSMPTRGAYRSFKMVSQLQRVVRDPYLPSCLYESGARKVLGAGVTFESTSTVKARLIPADDANRTGLLRTCAILSSAVYPAASVASHGWKKVKPSGDWLSMKFRLQELCREVSVVDCREDEEVCKPAYALCMDYKKHIIYVVVRGSSAVEDFVTDLMCDPVDSDLGPHRGMSRAADFMDLRVRSAVVEFVKTTPGSQVILTGHSLGAGTVALLTAKWLQEESMLDVSIRTQCVAIACPAILNEHDLFVSNQQIQTVVFGKDIVPRLSFGSFRDMLVQTKALADLEARGNKQAVGDVATAIQNMVDTPSTATLSTATPSTAATSRDDTDSSDCGSDEEEIKCLPERTDKLSSYESLRNVLITDVNFAGLSPAEREEQNRALAAQMKNCRASFGGASFNQVHKILKRRVEELDRARAKLMKHPETRALQLPGSGLKRFFLKLGWKLMKFFSRCCHGGSTKSIKVQNRDEENEFLRRCLNEVYELRCRTTIRHLTPPGRVLLCIPRLHFLEQQLPPPTTKKILLGQCYMYEVDREHFTQQSMTPVWSAGAVHQHQMACYLQALAPDVLTICPLDAILEIPKKPKETANNQEH